MIIAGKKFDGNWRKASFQPSLDANERITDRRRDSFIRNGIPSKRKSPPIHKTLDRQTL
jgi:hypothetical protein